MRTTALALSVVFLLACAHAAAGESASDDTQACLECHATATPGIVADWSKSRHAGVLPGEAMKKPALQKRISAKTVPEGLAGTTVGCAECHAMRPEAHPDAFDHEGFRVYTIVTPSDCAVCHPEEADQYSQNLMSNAYGNLMDNPLYRDLMKSINGMQRFEKGRTVTEDADEMTRADSCLHCHGTRIGIEGVRKVETDFGEMEFPALTGWPNQGVGRINPDKSMGACTSCHARHGFSIEMARKPYTCSQCHKGPDVPAYKVYEVSKHGNIHSSLGKHWDFTAVPWTAGKDFQAPTCAACHASLLVDSEGTTIAKRTHRMNDRLDWRILGLVYAHPRPKSPDTSIIKNKGGLNLATELTGEPVVEFLIDEKQQMANRRAMKTVCLACHSTPWVDGHFVRFDNTVKTTNAMTLTATQVLLSAWEKGAAMGPGQGDSPFNEAIEKMWVELWLFYANSTRYASAMSGADYGVFANGRWYMSKTIQEMLDHLEFKLEQTKKKK